MLEFLFHSGSGGMCALDFAQYKIRCLCYLQDKYIKGKVSLLYLTSCISVGAGLCPIGNTWE